MKKFIYISVAGLMVVNSATRCMELQIADVQLESDQPERAELIGPQLPSKQELAQQFMEAAVVVSSMSRYEVATSEEFKKMKEAYRTHIALNKGDKKQTKAELFGVADYFSEDEKYYEQDINDEDKTNQKITGIDIFFLPRNKEKATYYKNKTSKLESELEKVTATLKDLIIQKSNLKKELAEATAMQATLNTVDTIFSNNRDQEVALLRDRRGSLIEEIKAVEERIAQNKEESTALLDAQVTESIMADGIKNHGENIAKLSAEKKKLQDKLNKVEAVIAKLEGSKKGWFDW